MGEIYGVRIICNVIPTICDFYKGGGNCTFKIDCVSLLANNNDVVDLVRN